MTLIITVTEREAKTKDTPYYISCLVTYLCHTVLMITVMMNKQAFITTLMSQKRIPIPDIIDYNLKQDYKISIIFGKNIPDTTGHQMSVQVPASPSVCFCTTCGNPEHTK